MRRFTVRRIRGDRLAISFGPVKIMFTVAQALDLVEQLTAVATEIAASPATKD